MSYNPLLIANRIVEIKQRLTIMELLKLQYIAHGYSLAILNKPLFKGEIEAWPYGPVIRKVYNTFRNSQGIHITLPVAIANSDDEIISSDYENILQKVISIYKDKDGWELSALTHEDNSPWTKTVEAHGFYSEIPNDLTKSYYESLIS